MCIFVGFNTTGFDTQNKRTIGNMRTLLTFITLIALTSCGGGGGSSTSAPSTPTTASYSGVAVDGNLYKATAFLDLNGNGTYESGEPSATTDANGTFTLTATAEQISSHSVVVSAVAGTTIDQDTPNTPMTSGMTLMAPAGNPSVVSPLTTQVSAKMAAGLSLDAAKSAVQTELGLTNVDVMKNFVAEKASNSAYADAQKIAVSVAEVLKNIDSQSSVNTTLASKLTSLTSNVTSSVAPIASQIKSAANLDDARTAVNTQISAAVNIYNISGSISGLNASGLILANGTNTVSLSSGANTFTFSTKKATSSAYAVTVQANPTGQSCTITNASGTVATTSISNIAVTCTSNPGALSGTVFGLTTSGLVIKNGTDELTISAGASTFQFGSSVASGATYSVTVKTQPTGKTCSIANASGTMTSAGLSNVQVTCATNSYTLGGSISGLSTSGLQLLNGTETLSVNSGSASFTFNTSIAYSGSYQVTVKTQPTGYICTINNGSGNMGANNISSLQVTCSALTYTLSGSISGLNTDGLILSNGSETLSISSGSNSFIFTQTLSYGSSYAITVSNQPTGALCSISLGSGTNISANTSNSNVTCTSSSIVYLVVGGGGGGGASAMNLSCGAGGDGGTVLTGGINPVSGTTYLITVGTGGDGGSWQYNTNTSTYNLSQTSKDGGVSSISDQNTVTITANGGMAGMSGSVDSNGVGHPGTTSSTLPGAGEGCIGNSIIGTGIPGTQSSITGTPTYYGNGGAGGGTTGVINSSLGSGGNGGSTLRWYGYSGIEGTVILKMPAAIYSGRATGNRTYTEVGGYSIIQFIGAGSYTAK